MAQTDEEKGFLDCFFTLPVKSLPTSAIRRVVQEVTNLRMFVGAIKDVASEQIQFEAQTVVQNYSFLTLEEIALARRLFTQNKLIPLNTILNYPNFNSLFISQILNSYIDYRKVLLDELNRRKKPLIEYKPSATQQVKDMQYMVEEVFKAIEQDQYYILLLNTVFNYFYRTKKIAPMQDELYEASRYADKKYLDKKASQTGLLGDMSIGRDKDHLLQTFTREWCLKKHFFGKQLSDILNEIKEDEFK